jgi:hypothetical protein
MRTKLVFVLFACLTVSSYFLATTAAQTSRGRSGHVTPDALVQPDLPGLVAEVVAQGLATEGYKVHRDGKSVMFATELGEFILDLPATREAAANREVSVSLDGIVLMENGFVVEVGDEEFQHAQGGVLNLIDCILSALDIYGLKLDICEFSNGPELFCITEATFELTLNILRCVED